MINFICFLIAQGAKSAEGGTPNATPVGVCGGQGGLSPLLFLVVIFAIFYFLFIRPSQAQQKKHKEMIESLQKGDRVITQGGIYGKVNQVKDFTVKLKVDENTEIEFEKGMIRKVLKKES